MMIGAQTIPTISSTSSATPSGRGCRDGGERRSASRSARQQATRCSRRSVRRSGGGRFMNAATRRWTIWHCSMRTSAVGSTAIGSSPVDSLPDVTAHRRPPGTMGRSEVQVPAPAQDTGHSLAATHRASRSVQKPSSPPMVCQPSSRPPHEPPPNRRVRTRTHGGGGGAGGEAFPHPDHPRDKRRRRSQALDARVEPAHEDH